VTCRQCTLNTVLVTAYGKSKVLDGAAPGNEDEGSVVKTTIHPLQQKGELLNNEPP